MDTDEYSLTDTETSAYAWMQAEWGLEESDIQRGRTADFYVRGVPIEVKRPVNGQLGFTGNQKEYFESTDPKVLVFEDGEDEPTEVFRFSERHESRFNINQQPTDRAILNIRITDEEYEKLAEYIEQSPHFDNRSDFLRWAIFEMGLNRWRAVE